MSLERHFSWKGSVEVNSVIPLNFSKALSLKLFSANTEGRYFTRVFTHEYIVSRAYCVKI